MLRRRLSTTTVLPWQHVIRPRSNHSNCGGLLPSDRPPKECFLWRALIDRVAKEGSEKRRLRRMLRIERIRGCCHTVGSSMISLWWKWLTIIWSSALRLRSDVHEGLWEYLSSTLWQCASEDWQYNAYYLLISNHRRSLRLSASHWRVSWGCKSYEKLSTRVVFGVRFEAVWALLRFSAATLLWVSCSQPSAPLSLRVRRLAIAEIDSILAQVWGVLYWSNAKSTCIDRCRWHW